MFQLENKVVIVTGGASGIGLATVEAFLQKGSRVVISDYNEEAGQREAERLSEQGEVIFIKTNVADESQVKHLIDETVERFGSVDVVFNNAGVGARGFTHELTEEDYRHVIDINLDGVFYGIKHALAQMKKQGGGVIINCTSILGLVGEPSAFAYNASKHGVIGMTKSAALQYASDNIRVSAVAPGYVESGMVNKEALGDYYDTLVDRHPIGRLGQPEEIAHGVIFLAENEFATGLVLPIEGGYTAQ